MKYYNQHNYKGVPYPSGPTSTADIKESGCGVCAIANVLLFFGVTYDPKDLAQTFIKLGFRYPAGTDMKKAAKWAADTYNLELSTTSSEAELHAHLTQGGVAIANVDGDEGDKGIFSSAGHYINVIGTNAQRLVCFDVGYYEGKYNATYRKPYVALGEDKHGNTIQTVMQDTLHRDTKNRTPNYYLFQRRKPMEPMTKEQAKEIVKAKAELSDSTIAYLADDYRWGDELIIKLATAMKG